MTSPGDLQPSTSSSPADLASAWGSRPVRFARGLVGNLRCGVRLAVFLPLRRDRLEVSPEQLIALAVLDLLVGFLADFVAAGPHAQFNLWGLPGALFPVPLLLVSGYAAARITRDRNLSLALPIALLSMSPLLEIYSLALYLAANAQWMDLSSRQLDLFYSWSAFVWWSAAACVAVLRVTRAAPLRRLLAVAGLALLVIAPAAILPRGTVGALWLDNYERDGEEERSHTGALATEEAFYAQPEILRRQLAALKPGRPGEQDLYFVGVAGSAAEDVFRHELSVIRELFEQHFGTAGRSITLVNSPRTALREPIATVTSLERTLVRVGQVMKRDEDLLFLYLTSHGSQNHRLALEFWPLHLRDLDAFMLKRMLDAAGIRWRVVVVSACYSGGFIEPLKDEHTLLITAADPDHTSFGCGAESDFTYFGKAYFDEALRETYSFTVAFETARRSIEAREREEGRVRSNPQIFVGGRIAQKLQHMEHAWGARGVQDVTGEQ